MKQFLKSALRVIGLTIGAAVVGWGERLIQYLQENIDALKGE